MSEPIVKRLQFCARLHNEEEREAIQAAAHRAGLNVSEWGRLVLRAAAGYGDLAEDLQRARSAGSGEQVKPRRKGKGT